MSVFSSSSNTDFPHLATLGHLEQYANAANQANVHFKSCQWQLTKSRRKGNVMMSVETSFAAESLRDDWRARHRLVDINKNPEGELVDEDIAVSSAATPAANASSTIDKNTKTILSMASPEWKLQDILQENENIRDAGAATYALGADTTTTGLRQRKTVTPAQPKEQDDDDKEDDTIAWTLIEEDDLQDEEQLLLQRDPIEFFGGLLSRDLKRAQEEAHQALQGYITAANEAAKILAIVNKHQ
jgi:hypothetical protein